MSDSKTVSAMIVALAIAICGGVAGWLLASTSAQEDYLTNILLSFCAGLLTSLIFTALIQNVLAKQSSIEMKQQQKLNFSVGLYDSFHSIEMLEARCRAERLLNKISGQGFDIKQLYENLFLNEATVEEEKDWIALSGMLRFYERIHSLYAEGLIDRTVLRSNYKIFFDWLITEPTFVSLVAKSRENDVSWVLFDKLDQLKQDVFC